VNRLAADSSNVRVINVSPRYEASSLADVTLS